MKPIHLFLLVVLCTTCKPKAPEPRTVYNSFSMRVNGQEWKPWQDPADPCNSTFGSSYRAATGGPVVIPEYSINAYRDPSGSRGSTSQNRFRMGITPITKPGRYVMDGSWGKDFTSYADFRIATPTAADRDAHVFYVNDARRTPFVAIVEEIYIPKYMVSIPAVKGTFGGVLYNEDNPADSLVITNGKFNMVYSGGYHCGFEN